MAKKTAATKSYSLTIQKKLSYVVESMHPNEGEFEEAGQA